MRLTRLSREAVEGGTGQKIECVFLKKTGRKAADTKRKNSGMHQVIRVFWTNRFNPCPYRKVQEKETITLSRGTAGHR